MKKIVFCLIGTALFLIPFVARAEINAEVKIFDSQGGLENSFYAFYPGYQGNVSVVFADFGKDGKKIAIGRGSSNSPIVEFYNTDGLFSNLFDVFDAKFRGGSFVSAGDTDGDGKDELVVGAGYRGGPQVRVFEAGGVNTGNFFAYGEGERTGVKVLVADIDGDGKAEIITGPNLNREAEIKVFSAKGKLLKSQKLDLNSAGGVDLASGDVNGDGKNEIIVGSGYGNKSAVLVLDSGLKQIARLSPYGDYDGGVNVASGDVNGDGVDEIVASPSFHGQYAVKILKLNGDLVKEFTAYSENKYYGGIDLAMGDVDGDRKAEIITIPQTISAGLKSDAYKWVDVDLGRQTLTMWQDGRKLDTFLISSGKPRSPTPKGEFRIFNKRPKVNMSWYYGVGSPLNYSLPNVPWVASFKGPYTIHGTYWHKNFGHPMSHGCVNMYTPQAKLVYDFVDIGTPVIVY